MNSEILINIEQIKNSDSDIREGAFSRLVDFFLNNNYIITLENKIQYLNILCSNEYLFNKIELGITDYTVGRSFSILVIGLIIESDKNNEVNVEFFIPIFLKYISQESDFRGRDNDLGWIHVLAHLGDLLLFLSTHKKISKISIEQLSIALIEKIALINDQELSHSEDKRLAIGLLLVFEESIACKGTILNSIAQIAYCKNLRNKNFLNLLNCLYLELKANSKNKNLVEEVNLLLNLPIEKINNP